MLQLPRVSLASTSHSANIPSWIPINGHNKARTHKPGACLLVTLLWALWALSIHSTLKILLQPYAMSAIHLRYCGGCLMKASLLLTNFSYQHTHQLLKLCNFLHSKVAVPWGGPAPDWMLQLRLNFAERVKLIQHVVFLYSISNPLKLPHNFPLLRLFLPSGNYTQSWTNFPMPIG